MLLRRAFVVRPATRRFLSAKHANPPPPAQPYKPESEDERSSRLPNRTDLQAELASQAAQTSKKATTRRPPTLKQKGRRITALMVSLPLSIWIGWELFQRRFMGKEQKTIPGQNISGQ